MPTATVTQVISAFVNDEGPCVSRQGNVEYRLRTDQPSYHELWVFGCLLAVRVGRHLFVTSTDAGAGFDDRHMVRRHCRVLLDLLIGESLKVCKPGVALAGMTFTAMLAASPQPVPPPPAPVAVNQSVRQEALWASVRQLSRSYSDWRTYTLGVPAPPELGPTPIPSDDDLPF